MYKHKRQSTNPPNIGMGVAADKIVVQPHGNVTEPPSLKMDLTKLDNQQKKTTT